MMINNAPDRISPPAGWRDNRPASRQEHLDLSDWADDQCTPSRRISLTAQPQAEPKPIVYAQYDSQYDVDLHPELDAPVQPQPVKTMPAPKPQPVPAEPEGIPVDWPTRIVTPVPLQPRA